MRVGDTVVAARIIDDSEAPVVSYDPAGEEEVSRSHVLDFKDVANGIQAMAGSMVDVLKAVAPDKWSVEFNVGITAKAGRLTALFFDPEVEGSVKVVLEWGGKDAK
jgi:hypothetical protein